MSVDRNCLAYAHRSIAHLTQAPPPPELDCLGRCRADSLWLSSNTAWLRKGGSRPIEKSLFHFIWKYSRSQQIVLLIVTVALFPFLYLTLELPKRIINDAIGAGQDVVEVYGYELSQITFLMVLCGLFLLSVLAHGLLKMRINTMKGVLAERMLRRLRYQLITRLFRFPKPYFQRTSQAEITSMVTAECEPLGGMMGDAISQPIMQAGQMLTILTFLFLQSFWFGLAAVSMIPLQAWLIPILQRQVNALNKERIKEVRVLAGQIGETAVGAEALRTSGGYGYRAAQITAQLGTLFFIRFRIYQKKFFMKFLNNFLGQLTPFFFFSIGGYLVIQGNVSIGALVAALAAYKDLSSPWKELLTYYTRAHEMAQRWTLVTERFAPAGTLDEALITAPPDAIERLTGDIVFDKVTARDQDGIAVVEDLSLTLPAGGLIGIAARGEEDRRALSELLTRELLPTEGRILIGGQDLAKIHQAQIGARIGWADSAPYLFAGTIRDNMLMALRTHPTAKGEDDTATALLRHEAERSGNSAFLPTDTWADPHLANLRNIKGVEDWWMRMVEAMGADRDAMRRALSLRGKTAYDPAITAQLPQLRPLIRQKITDQGLDRIVLFLDRDAYNPAVPLLHNILFAAPRQRLTRRELAAHPDFLPLLEKTGLTDGVYELALAVIDTLYTTFGSDGTDHPLFQRLNVTVATYTETLEHHRVAKEKGLDALPEFERALLLAIPCLFRPEHIGQVVPDWMQKRIVGLRHSHRSILDSHLTDIYEQLDPERYADGLTLLENATFGLVDTGAGARADDLRELVIDALTDNGLKIPVARLSLNEETTLGGSNLARNLIERIAFTRAAIKRPDIFVLNKVLASYDQDVRRDASQRLRLEMPEATIIYLEEQFDHPENFDLYLELRQGRITVGGAKAEAAPETEITEPDLATKLQVLEETPFFASLDRKQMRLLAFSAQWFEKEPGEMLFAKGDDPGDGAYLILKGEADFLVPQDDGSEKQVRTLGAGSLVGELALILGEPRSLTARAKGDLAGLRIGGEEFLAVVHNDAETSFKVLQEITRYLSRIQS